jgi:hypothetical protein
MTTTTDTTDSTTADTTPTDSTTTDTTPTGTTPTDSGADVESIIDGYFACWNTTDTDERERFVRRYWGSGARLVDPLVDVTGHDAIIATMAMFHDTYAGSSFRRSAGIDVHHHIARWGWEMVDAEGNVTLDGLDVALIGDDGTIGYCVGFFGAALPPA